MKELFFEVSEDDVDGGYTASALGYGIHTQGDTTEELRQNIKEAVDCYFEKIEDVPRIIRLHFVRDEVMAV
jgi:predicted RNase H-like HicB family nuclease